MKHAVPRCLIATVESDSHMWNLVYLQIWLAEQGFDVRNLGCCTPRTGIVEALGTFRPHLVVVSSVNGHGYYQGRAIIESIRQRDPDVPCVIGGKLTTSEADHAVVRAGLLEAGYASVFLGADAMAEFSSFLERMRLHAPGAGAEPPPAGRHAATPLQRH